MENGNIEKFKWDILGDFQTLCLMEYMQSGDFIVQFAVFFAHFPSIFDPNFGLIRHCLIEHFSYFFILFIVFHLLQNFSSQSQKCHSSLGSQRNFDSRQFMTVYKTCNSKEITKLLSQCLKITEKVPFKFRLHFFK